MAAAHTSHSMKPGRNDPCPCGSGLKYKKCCGAVIRIESLARKSSSAKAFRRQCGECTACCDGWVKMVVYGHDIYPGKPCPYSTGHSCAIYQRRPVNPCRNFACGWLQPGSPFPEEFRPDRLGVMILPSRWSGGVFYILVPAGRDPDGKLLDWMGDYARRMGHPFIYQTNGNWIAHGPEPFQTEIAQRRARGEPMW